MERTKKSIACFLFFLVMNAGAFAQDIYFVTFVKGDIKKADQAKVKVGDKIPFQEKLIFSNKDCKLILLHPQKGRFILEPGTVAVEPSGEYFIYLKYNLHLSNDKLKLSSRGEGDANLEEFFTINPSINKSILFIGDTKISLKNSAYRVNDPANDFFFLQYSAPGGKPVNKKLEVLQDSLLINASDFLFSDSKAIEYEEIKFGLIQNYSKDRKMTKITSFIPVLMSRDDCKIFIRIIKESLGNNKEKVMEESLTQLYYYYGKPDKNMLMEIYDEL